MSVCLKVQGRATFTDIVLQFRTCSFGSAWFQEKLHNEGNETSLSPNIIVVRILEDGFRFQVD